MAPIEIDSIFPANETSIYGWDFPVRYVTNNQMVNFSSSPVLSNPRNQNAHSQKKMCEAWVKKKLILAVTWYW